MLKRVLATFVLAVAVSVPTAAADPAMDDFPFMETIIHREGIEPYLALAQRYVQRHGDSPLAARVLLDVYVLNSARAETAQADTAKAMLLVRYPSTAAGIYMLTTFDGGESYGQFMHKALGRALRDFESPVRADRLTAAARPAHKRFGVSVFDHLPFGTVLVAACDLAGDMELRDAGIAYLRARHSSDEHVTHALRAGFERGTPVHERVLKLHALPRAGKTSSLERFLLGSLNDADRQRPAIRRIMAEHHLALHQYDKALPLLNELVDANGEQSAPPLKLYRAWAMLLLGDHEQAVTALNALQADHPDSPWARTAGMLLPELEELEKSQADLIATMVRVVRLMLTHSDQVELNVHLDVGGGKPPLDAYLAFTSDGLLELHVKRQQAVLLAFRSTASESRLYMPKERMTQRFAQSAGIPLPNFNLSRSADGMFNAQFGMEFGSAASFSDSVQRILASRWLNTDEGLRELVTYSMTQGAIPARTKATDGGRRFTLLSLQLGEPELQAFTVIVDDDNHLIEGQWAGLRLHGVRYGKDGDFDLTPPPWPDGPIVDREKADFATFLRILGEVASIVVDTYKLE